MFTAAASRKEILGIDLLRFAAAMMVAFYHTGFWGFFGNPNLYQQTIQSYNIGYLLAPFSYFGWVGVEIFFVISGFVIAYSAENATPFSFFRNRFVRLMPGLWIGATLAIPEFCLDHGGEHLVRVYLKTLVLYPPAMPWIEGVLWTLFVEICFYMVIFALLLGNAFKHLKWVMGGIGTVSAIYWFAYATTMSSEALLPLRTQLIELSWTLPMQFSLMHHGCFFGLGVMLWLILIKGERGACIVFAPILMLGCLFEVASVNDMHVGDTNILQPALMPVTTWAVMLGLLVFSIIYNDAIRRKLKPVEGQVRWLGLSSYQIYLLHRPVSVAVLYLSVLAGFHQYVAWATGIVAAAIAVIAATSYAEPWLQRHTRNAINAAYNTMQRYVLARVGWKRLF